jgi:eukaryotic-like serine/threonine-protein kinase
VNFGISKLATSEAPDDALTRAGQSVGVFSYMPPEQIGKAKTVDLRADIYACSTLIYQALSGQLPFTARNVLVMIETKTKNDPRSLADAMKSEVSPALEDFLARGLARVPASRFATAEEALQAWRALSPVKTRAEGGG